MPDRESFDGCTRTHTSVRALAQTLSEYTLQQWEGVHVRTRCSRSGAHSHSLRHSPRHAYQRTHIVLPSAYKSI
eukprot:6177696-Pleurochrysis_carterae.AAC.2